MNVGNLISGSSAFSKTSLNIWKFTVHILLKPDLENFEHYFAIVWVECSCLVVWAFFGIAFLWNYFLLTPNLMVKHSVVTAVLKVGMGMISYYTQSLLWMNFGICLLFPCYSTRCWKPQQFLLAQRIPSEWNHLVWAAYFLGSLNSLTNGLLFLTVFKKFFFYILPSIFSGFLQESEPK